MTTKQEIQELIERVENDLPLYKEDLITTLYEPIVAKHHLKTEQLLKDTLTALQEYQAMLGRVELFSELSKLVEGNDRNEINIEIWNGVFKFQHYETAISTLDNLNPHQDLVKEVLDNDLDDFLKAIQNYIRGKDEGYKNARD